MSFGLEDHKQAMKLVDELPVHETAVCPQCGWGGVAIRFDVCECHRAGCGYRWRWPLVGMG